MHSSLKEPATTFQSGWGPDFDWAIATYDFFPHQHMTGVEQQVAAPHQQPAKTAVVTKVIILADDQLIQYILLAASGCFLPMGAVRGHYGSHWLFCMTIFYSVLAFILLSSNFDLLLKGEGVILRLRLMSWNCPMHFVLQSLSKRSLSRKLRFILSVCEIVSFHSITG